MLVAGLVLLSILLAAIFSKANPPKGIYMRQEQARLGSIKQQWIPIEEFSRSMALAVVASEDANFCNHSGFDIDAIKQAWNEGAQRGGSTLSQQVAKNVFLWHGRSWLRKGLEAWFTFLIELTWSKKRIVEVYLNVAEFDAGVFGAAAGAKHYFGAMPSQITQTQAARLAAILPNPKVRSASRPSKLVRRRTVRAISGAKTIQADGRASCF